MNETNKKKQINNDDELLILNQNKKKIQKKPLSDIEEKTIPLLQIKKKKKSTQEINKDESQYLKENENKILQEKDKNDSKLISSSLSSSSSSSSSSSNYEKYDKYPSIKRKKIINIKKLFTQKTQKKILKKSKYLNVIRKFHNVYQQLAGKNFIVEKEYQNQTNIEYYRKLINIQILICVIAFLSILTGILYYEKTYVENKEKAKSTDTVILYFLNIQSVLLFIAIILKEKIKLKSDIDLKNE